MVSALTARIVAYLLLVALVVAGGLSIRKAYAERALFKQQLATEKAITEDFKVRVHESFRLGERRAADAEAIRTVTQEIVHEVEVRIPADACPLPADWRVLHDGAAQGKPRPATR